MVVGYGGKMCLLNLNPQPRSLVVDNPTSAPPLEGYGLPMIRKKCQCELVLVLTSMSFQESRMPFWEPLIKPKTSALVPRTECLHPKP